MSGAIRLDRNDWSARRPFTHPGLAVRDCQILIGLLRDVHKSRHAPPQIESPVRGRDRLVITASGRRYDGEPLAIVGFFGERNPAGSDEVAEGVERVNASMVADFDEFPILLAYVSRMLDDGFNYANLVVLSGADGIEAWREMPDHVVAVSELAPNFYNSVRIYNGSLHAGLDHPEELELNVVKFWDYRGRRVWHATRDLSVAD